MTAQLQDAIDFYHSGNYAMAMSTFGRALEGVRQPEPAHSLMMAQSCYRLDQISEAAKWYEKACVPNLPNVEVVQTLAANLHIRQKNWARAHAIAVEALKVKPDNLALIDIHRRATRALLLFDEMQKSNRIVKARQEAGDPAYLGMENPLDHLFWLADEAIEARLTHMDGGTPFTTANRILRRTRKHTFSDRIRVAYLSNDLSDRHATMRLLQGVITSHDPKKFEIITLCHTPQNLQKADQGMRARLPYLVETQRFSDEVLVKDLRQKQIDILVDLKGHTKDPRLDVINLGAAPIQVAWLGYPGINTGIDCDYVIGDRFVTPPESQQHWDSQFCRLPESYQPNDDRYRALPPPASRKDLGLPENKVIFASFNSTLKISPETFKLWMQILKRTPNSILWMLCELPDARKNFTDAMKKAGIAKNRVIFADFADYPAHIARLQAADLGIDTFPCNGHTTTSDKLWAGLPMATKRGTNFASRVSESLLNAIGLPELVAEDEASYVDLNVRLATDHEWRNSLKQRLTDNRFRAPLFDTERFTRHLESAFEMMVERAKAGLAPAPMDVPALPPRDKPFRT